MEVTFEHYDKLLLNYEILYIVYVLLTLLVLFLFAGYGYGWMVQQQKETEQILQILPIEKLPKTFLDDLKNYFEQ